MSTYATAALAVPAAPGTLGLRDFRRLADFIEQYSGIKMPPTKQTMLEGRLRRRLRATGLPDLATYCRHIFDEGGMAAEACHLIDVVTTNKTDFFREPEHFRLLSEKLVPSAPAASGCAPFKAWSAAASIGAEAYSIAMVLAEFALPRSFSIVATDISSEVLATAASGIYPASMMTPVPTALRQRYVMRSRDSRRDVVRIVPELRTRIRFARLNLMDAGYPVDRDMDVIFCRNILIYFDRPTQAAVLSRLCSHLRPGGTLIVGHSETLTGLDLPLRPAGPTAFELV